MEKAMGEIHNLQVVISQSNLLNRLNQGPLKHAANGAQVLNVVNQDKATRRLSSVQELSESEKTEREEPRKRRIKKASTDQLIDRYE
jgi:hypothetical protein